MNSNSAVPLTIGLSMLFGGCAKPQQATGADSETMQPPAVVLEKLDEMGDGVMIVGGTTAGPNDNPFQVGLLVKSEADNFRAQFCGGSLVAPDIVVTAAHCNYYQESERSPLKRWENRQVQVLTGTRSLRGGGERLDVTDIVQHTSYKPNEKGYDVAVWKLATPAQDIPLAQLATSDGTVGSELLATGWGATASKGTKSPELLKVSVPIVSHSTCEAAYPGKITPQMLCAGFAAGGKDSCQGDSGGPATRGQGAMTLTGIVSWGFDCAQPGKYGVYTRVSDPTIREMTITSQGMKVIGPFSPSSGLLTGRAAPDGHGTREDADE